VWRPIELLIAGGGNFSALEEAVFWANVDLTRIWVCQEIQASLFYKYQMLTLKIILYLRVK
jgi:hypothetical protein